MLVEVVAVTGLYALLACLICWPLPAEIGTSVLGVSNGDAGGGLWWYDALQATGYHLWGTTDFTTIAIPFGNELSNGLNLQWLIPSYPTYLATSLVGEIAAYNLEILVGFTASSLTMYLLARRLGCAPLVAGWAGMVWMVFPWHFERAVAGHPSLVHLEFLPLVLVALHAAWERPGPKRAFLVGLTVVCCWLTSGLYGVMALVVVLVAGAITAAWQPSRRTLREGALFVGVAVVASGAVYAVAIPGGGDSGVGEARVVDSLSIYGLRPTELVVPAPSSIAFSQPLEGYYATRSHGSNTQEISNNVGLVTIGLALLWLTVAVRTRRALSRPKLLVTACAGASAIAAFALAIPSPVLVLGMNWTTTPSYLLWKVIPAFRIPARWSVVIMLGITILGALGLQWLWKRFAVRSPTTRIGLPAVLAILLIYVVSFLELSTAPSSLSFRPDRSPPEYRLVERARAGALAEYPLVGSDTYDNSEYLLRQRRHGRPLLNGGSIGSAGDALRRSLIDPAGFGTAGQLAAAGVSVIVTRNDLGAALATGSLPDFEGGVGYARIGAPTNGAAVWEVTARRAPALTMLSTESFGEPTVRSGTVVMELTGPRGEIWIDGSASSSATLRTIAYAIGAMHTDIVIAGAHRRVTQDGTRLSVPVRLRNGRLVLELRLLSPDAGVSVALSPPSVLRNRATS